MISEPSDAAPRRTANSRNVVNRSPMRAAAISWVIACGLLCGGTGMLAATPAAAEPGTIGNSDGGRGADSGSDSNDARGTGRFGGRPDGQRKPRLSDIKPGDIKPGDIKPGSARPDGGVVGGPRRRAEPPRGSLLPGLPELPGWPCLPLPHFPPIVLPPLPPLPPIHWPHNPLGDGVGAAAPPSARISPPPESGGGGGSGGGISIAPRTPPGEPGQPGEPPVVSAASGAIGPGTLEPPPITMPPMIGLPPAFSAPVRPVGPGAEPAPRTGPGRESNASRERPPATSSGAAAEMPPSTRVGYPRYLREAKMGEVAALALPGFAGLLGLTALGGVFGYRQAKAGHVVRTAGTARFLP